MTTRRAPPPPPSAIHSENTSSRPPQFLASPYTLVLLAVLCAPFSACAEVPEESVELPASEPRRNNDEPSTDGGNATFFQCASAIERIDPNTLARSDSGIRALALSRTGVNGLRSERSNTLYRYVSAAGGDDAEAGTEGAPWRTLQHAADRVEPGTTVLVDDSGVYAPVRFERGGKPGRFVIFKGLDESIMPTIEGDANETALVSISTSFLVFEGFRLENHQRTSLSKDTVGIQIEPNGVDLDYVEVLNNVIRNIGPSGLEDESCYYNGHGIIARAEEQLISHLLIAGNELSELYVGNSEVLVVNGNVSDFCVASNYIHDVNNIAIDIIGYELNSDETTRRGWIVDNVVLDASNYWPYCSRGNCTYPRGDESSDGIYVDGGAELEIAYNIVGRADHGIELQSENNQLIRDVEVHDNLVFNSNYANITIGEVSNSREFDNVTVDESALIDPQLEGCK